MDNEINKINESNKEKLLESIQCITGTVIKTALKRNKENEIRWIDMKFDPVTGKDIYDKNKWYSKNQVYSWIQGRSLETICEFLDFMADEESELCDRKELIEVGDSIYDHLKPLVENWEDGKASRSIPFVFDQGLKETSEEKALYPSISDMFVYKGLLLYAFTRKKEADIPSLVENLRYISRVAVEGNLINDQIDYKTGLKVIEPGKGIGLEGDMLAIGSSSILYKVTKDKKDLDLGFDALLDTLDKHSAVNSDGKIFVTDYIDLDGKPVKNKDGSFENNPGHTLEICGMGLQFLRENASQLVCQERYDFVKEKLIEIGCYHFKNGLTPVGTVYLGLDINSKKPIKAISPWWSSFESMRTLSEIYFFNRSVEVLDMLFKLKEDLTKVYLERSVTGIPIQTVDDLGKVVSIIPATADLDPGYHTALPLFDVYRLFSNFFAGFSKVDIDLEEGVRLQGHASRLGLADGILDPLSVHAIIMNSGLKRNAIIVCDLIELDQEMIDSLVCEINREFAISTDCIMISTIHTHTGPAAIRLGNLKPTENFKKNLKIAVKEAVKKAEKDFDEVKVGVYRNQVEGIGVNRRFLEDGKVVMKPNFKGDIDKDLVTVAFYDNTNNLKGLLLHVSLHPTTLGVDIHKYSADYLGGLYREIAKLYDVNVVVMQGACGDVRPCILDETGTGFVDGTYDDCIRIGKRIAEKVDEAIEKIKNNGLVSIKAIHSQKGKCKLKVKVESLNKVMQTLKTSEEMLENVDELTKDLDPFSKAHDCTAMLLKDDIYWCKEMLDNYDKGKVFDYVEADFAFLKLDELVDVAFLPGEAFVSIGERIKAELNSAETMICGYYSGSVGYIPNREAFKEGGYEVDQAFRSYGYAGPFEENVEDQVVVEIMKLSK